MEKILEFMRTDTFLIVLTCIVVLLLIGYIVNVIKLSKLRNGYKTFMTKLGNGRNVEEDLKGYIGRVEQAEEQIAGLTNYCKRLDSNVNRCIQKVGMVRYSAFRDMGSDLSFALALLDDKDNGVLLNGIYSREMSNIYAKPIEAGKTSYTLTKEEQEALEKAMNNTQGK